VTAPSTTRPRRALLIDYGGVLTTNVYQAFQEFATREGLAADAVVAALYSGPAARQLLIGLEEGTAPETDFERGFGKLLGVEPEGLIKRLVHGMRLDHRMIDAVRAVRRAGVPTALVSNSWGTDFYPADLLAELFDEVVISGRVGMRKPSREIYLHAVRALGQEPRDCVFVDDLARNLRAAAELGIATLHHTDADATICEMARLFGIEIATADAEDPEEPAADDQDSGSAA
jgi:putative hydrolase of the HAD superfamily